MRLTRLSPERYKLGAFAEFCGVKNAPPPPCLASRHLHNGLECKVERVVLKWPNGIPPGISCWEQESKSGGDGHPEGIHSLSVHLAEDRMGQCRTGPYPHFRTLEIDLKESLDTFVLLTKVAY